MINRSLDEAMALLEIRLHRKIEGWEINLRRSIGGNWTIWVVNPSRTSNPRIYGFDGMGTEKFRRGPAAAIENLLEHLGE